MDETLARIEALSGEELRQCAEHLMVGGGTRGGPILHHGKGVRVWDVEGKEYIDCTSQSWALYLGYGNEELWAAIDQQARMLTHVHQGFDTLPRFYLARKLAQIMPPSLNRVSFVPSSALALEGAMKLALKNRPGSSHFLSLWDGYHGTTLGTMGASWVSTKSNGSYIGGSRFLPLTRQFVRVPNPDCYHCPFDQQPQNCDLVCAKMLELTLEKGVNGPAAGVLVEPLQASAGMIPCPKRYLQKVREICDKFEVLLIFDEVQTYIRIGKFTAAEYYDVCPDLIGFGKAIGGGLPLGVTAIRDGLEEAAQKGTVREFMSGVRKNLTDNLEEAMPRVLKEIRENVAKQVTIEGPSSFPKILGKVQEEMDALGIYHARRTEEIAEMVRAMPDKDLANKLWVRYQDEADAYYTRMFNKLDATMQGFRSGVTKDKALAPFADIAVENFKQLKNGWKGFWKSKRTRSNAYFQPKYKGPKWGDIAEQTSKEFDEMVTLEAQLQKNIDNAVAMALPEAERGRYLAGQFQLAELRRTDKDALVDLFAELKNKTAFEREQIWKRAVKERYERFEAIEQQQHINIAAIEGDPKAVTQLDEVAAAIQQGRLAPFGETTAEEIAGVASGERPFAFFGGLGFGAAPDELPEGLQIVRGVTTYGDEPVDIVYKTRAANEADILDADIDHIVSELSRIDSIDDPIEEGVELGRLFGYDDADVQAWKANQLQQAAPVAKTYQSGSYENLTKGSSYPDDAVLTDEWWLTRGHPGLDAIERSTLTQASKPPMMFSDIPKDAQKYLENYVEHVTGQMGDARYASTRFAEFGRDAALLNYNRRYNFNTWLGTIMPFEFWTTHSMMKWALHSIDRPAMLTSYLRLQKMMLASGAPGQALPARLKGQFRIPFPWLPDWAGDTIFFDPLKALIPFDNFAYGYENEMKRRTGLEGKTMFILNDMAENNQADQAEVDNAIASQAGPLWEKAEQQALDDNEDLRFNAWDFASMLSAPHAPLDWAVKSLQGRPEDIGPFMPASRTIKGVAGLLGVDWSRHPMNLEGRVRDYFGTATL
ncbi:hypothetical protein LCGC14_1286720 [marine sediment metagenome]|uniref:Uncharacterized protein n=1 Tax=marine sediment metagenome TaxID=412755 RepID=A0A0F9NA76_9ZZZZ